jgi:hypothetical protein
MMSNETLHNRVAVKSNYTCCFNHKIGLPQKNGVKHNLYPYEHLIFKELMRPEPPLPPNQKAGSSVITERTQYKHLWILKATGLGITEFFLRFIAWMCLRNDDWKGKRVCIVTGPNIALAITLIKRMKALFRNPKATVQLSFDTKETIIILNGVLIEAFPSHHIDAMRGLPNIVMIFLDEASFFGVNDYANVLDVTERYIAKSDPYIVLCSTPNKPNDTDIMFKISRQQNENCIYHRIMLPYTVGLGNIFSHKEIEIAKKSNSFQREYDLAFLGVEGNVFIPQKIDEAIEAGKNDLELYSNMLLHHNPAFDIMYYMGIDPSFGTSAFGIILVAVLDNKVHVIESREMYRQQFQDCISEVGSIMLKYHLTRDSLKILVDSSSPAVVAALKVQLGDKPDYVSLINYRKHMGVRDPTFDMCVIPVNFDQKTKRQILLNVKELLDQSMIAINQNKHTNLISSLRTAIATDLILDKKNTTSDDLLDALCLSCMRISINQPEVQRYDFKVRY